MPVKAWLAILTAENNSCRSLTSMRAPAAAVSIRYD